MIIDQRKMNVYNINELSSYFPSTIDKRGFKINDTSYKTLLPKCENIAAIDYINRNAGLIKGIKKETITVVGNDKIISKYINKYNEYGILTSEKNKSRGVNKCDKYKYNNLGNIISHTNIYNGDVNFEMLYCYNDDGNNTITICNENNNKLYIPSIEACYYMYEDDKITQLLTFFPKGHNNIIYKYENDRLISKSYFSSDNIGNDKVIYRYDELGNIIAIIPKDIRDYYRIFEYDDNKIINAKIFSNSNGELVRLFEFDLEGRITYELNNIYGFNTIYEYDEKSMHSNTKYNINSNILCSDINKDQDVYTLYNDSGDVIQIKTSDNEEFFNYNDKGQLIEIDSDRENITYEYDDKGNCIRYNCNIKDKHYNHMEKIIDYKYY